MIATHLARKSSHNNNNQCIQRHTPNYKKIPFFDGYMCKLDSSYLLVDSGKPLVDLRFTTRN